MTGPTGLSESEELEQPTSSAETRKRESNQRMEWVRDCLVRTTLCLHRTFDVTPCEQFIFVVMVKFALRSQRTADFQDVFPAARPVSPLHT